MKQRMYAIAFAMLLFWLLPGQAEAAQLLIPVGEIVGLELRDDTVTVAAFDDARGEAARSAGLRIGDQILQIDGHTIKSAGDVRQALEDCGERIQVQIRRGEKIQTLSLRPQEGEDGARLGVYLRQGITGIGTITFYDPGTGEFGTLGHGVSDARGKLLEMTRGNAYDAQVLSVKKGESGDPGQLKGTAEAEQIIGTLRKNTPQGVFGISPQGWLGEPVPVGEFEDVQTGPATIRSTVSGDRVQEYSVEILRIYPRDRADGRNFLLKVTDQRLLDITGGIVQGMSGSPIIQNGKLVGAVTHV